MVKRATSKKLPINVRVPDKAHFYISEAAKIIASHIDTKPKTIGNRIYNRIDSGHIDAVKVLGVTMLERAELIKIMSGDPV